jgi:hypothetical protein
MLDWIELSEAQLEALDGALPAGTLKAADTISVASVVRKGNSGAFSTVGLQLGDEIYYPTDAALNQIAATAKVPLGYVSSLPDPLLRANFNYALGKLARERSLAAIVQERQIIGWARAEWAYLRPSQFLARVREANPHGAPLGLLGKPASIGCWLMRYRLSTPELAHVFTESPVRADRHHFAVEMLLDHSGWKPAQVAAFGLRLVCRNGMTAPFGPRPSEQIWPRSADRFLQDLSQAIRRGFRFIRMTLIPRLEQSIRTPLAGGAERIATLLDTAPEAVRRLALSAHQRLENLGETEYRLVNALTGAATSPECPPAWSERLSRLAGELAAGRRCSACLRPLKGSSIDLGTA